MHVLRDILLINNEYYAIAELNALTTTSFVCNKLDNEFTVDLSAPKEWLNEQLANAEVVGQINDKSFELMRRQLIFSKVEEFHDLFHIRKSFSAGESNLSYAGKIYDKKEMV